MIGRSDPVGAPPGASSSSKPKQKLARKRAPTGSTPLGREPAEPAQRIPPYGAASRRSVHSGANGEITCGGSTLRQRMIGRSDPVGAPPGASSSSKPKQKLARKRAPTGSTPLGREPAEPAQRIPPYGAASRRSVHSGANGEITCGGSTLRQRMIGRSDPVGAPPGASSSSKPKQKLARKRAPTGQPHWGESPHGAASHRSVHLGANGEITCGGSTLRQRMIGRSDPVGAPPGASSSSNPKQKLARKRAPTGQPRWGESPHGAASRRSVHSGANGGITFGGSALRLRHLSQIRHRQPATKATDSAQRRSRPQTKSAQAARVACVSAPRMTRRFRRGEPLRVRL